MASSTSTKVSLKLLIDTKSQRVLFGEASKEFIDFLFNLLRLPIGTVIRLLTKKGMVGSIGKLYESIENLNENYLLNPDRDILLKPSAPLNSENLLLPNVGMASVPSNLFMCPNRCKYNVTETRNTVCPSCGSSMGCNVQIVGKKASGVTSSSSGEGGFVKGVVTYTVMDDLEVCPMSTISCVTMLSKFNIKEIGSLKERVVDLGIEEGIKLLKASLECKNVLSSVFLKDTRVMMEQDFA